MIIKRQQKYNSIYLGLAIGIFVPLFAFVVFYLIHQNDFGFDNIIQAFSEDSVYSIIKKELLAKVLSLCIIPNLLAFFGFLKINRLFSARGILIATLIYAGIIVILKFLV